MRLSKAALGLTLTVLAICCGGVDVHSPPGPREASDAPTPPRPSLGRVVTDHDDALAFPPPGDQVTRPALPDAYRRHLDQSLALVEPQLDGSDVWIEARDLVLTFNKPMQGARAGLPAGEHLTVAPAEPRPGDTPITGLVEWQDERRLRFSATTFFDPGRGYRATLHGLASRAGEPLADLEVPFRSHAGGVVAGKIIGHRVKPGLPRLVAADIPDELAPRFGVSVLFDQPIAVEEARHLVQIFDVADQPIPAVHRHDLRARWSGVSVDPRFVIEVRPRKPLAAGDTIKVVARDAKDERIERTATIAAPLAFLSAECSYWHDSDEICELEGDTLHTDRQAVHLLFQNRIGTASRLLPQLVRVTPKPRNLRVSHEGWDRGRVVIEGDFRPSVRYRVTAQGLTDIHGQRLEKPVSLEVQMKSLAASVAMPEGLVFLDPSTTSAFPITSRNVARAALELRPVDEADPEAVRAALRAARGGEAPSDADAIQVAVDIAAKRDELVTTEVDLTKVLPAGKAWLATVRPLDNAFGAPTLQPPEGTPAARPPVALLEAGGANSLALHAHRVAGSTVFQVSRLVGGAPVKAAEVRVGDHHATTDDQGVAVLPVGEAELALVTAGEERLAMPLDSASSSSRELFADLAVGHQPESEVRGFVMTDRGIYRPGSTIGIKATAMRPEGAELRPVKGQARHLRLRDPKGETICEHAVTTNDMGSAAADCHVPHGASLGLYRVEVRRGDAVEGHSLVRVADFEPPRFKVDVDAKATRAEDRASLSASVDAKYLFGSPMSGGNVRWSLERRPAPFPNGPLTAAGLSFRPEPSWIYDEEQVEAKWSRVGEGMLDEAGRLSLTQALPMDGADGPQRFVLEADVSDASYRHVANRAEVVVDAAPVYAGLRGPSGWVRSGGDVSVELGAIDGEGRSVIGKTVTATLFEVTWRYLERLGPGGAIHTEWRRQEVERGRCSVVSAERAERCDLRALSGGDYRLVASVDGRSGGSSWFWVWGDDGEKRKTTPSRGPVVQVVADKGRYQAGETAKLLVRSPYPAATMVTTFEMGGLVGHESQRITGPVGLVNVPIRAEHAPHLHASITLLPMGAVGRDRASYRVGAIRLPVDGKSAALAVKVASDRPSYRPRDEATVTVEVQADGKPLPHAEVALAVVDEGVLRLTGFHAPNPGDALRPPMALDFVAFDSREGLLGLFERSHVAGDGGGEGDDSLPHARRRFVETALWRPMLRTDAAGKAQVRFTLPDNLTEFRMMAVAVDPAGRSGNEEASFLVKKDLMVDPILPRFAHVGDRFELAAMVHNGSDQPFDGSVQLDTVQVPVSLPAGARKRVATTTDARSPGLREITVALRDAAGEVKDAAKRRLPVQQPGYAVHPSLAGAFREELKIDLTLPASAMLEPEESLTLKLGEHLWPELGTRLEYLLDYPHGCVEQTTSSTLPLVAGREILPRIGLDRHDARFFTDRIKAGVDRLATMRTSSGGLAYWPGDSDPSIFGTAYAIRAVSAAHDAGIPLSPGLLEGMTSYLEARLREESTSIELRAVIAESLAAMPQGLPPGIADALWDRRGDMSAFARASLTLALARDAAQADRVRTLSDDLVALLDDQGKLREEPAVHHEYYGSPQRTESQIARALTATRPDEPRLLLLASRLAEVTGRYTTQATAFTLLALADYLQGLPAEGVTIAATLDGEPLAQRRMASGAVEVSIPLAELVGKKRRLRVKGDGKTALGYALAARYRLPLGDESLRGEARAVAELEGASGKAGPHVYRMITTPAGDPVDPSKVAAGELLRVALLVDFPSGAERRYLALTDPLPAGLEPVQTDLASVTNDPGIGDQHPLADHLRWSLHQISHLELHDDRMQLYVDDVGSSVIAASYLVRATTPGTFATPPAMAELMYQAGSTSFTEGSEITIQ